MNNGIILSNNQIAQLEQLNSQIAKYPESLEQTIFLFNQILRTPHMTAWVSGSDAAKSLEQRLRGNIQGIHRIIQAIRQIRKTNERLIQMMRENNQTTI